MNLFSRHKNTVVLAAVLLAQLLALAVQVKRQTADGPVRVIRLVAVHTLAPFERLLIYSGESVRAVWSGYIDLRGVRKENARLKAEAGQMRLERAREQEDARQARRIQALLGFKEQWIDTTVAAQVIGTSGTETSRLLELDKGAKDGIKVDMPVITPDGVAGKILAVYGDHISQVLLINDPTSGVGATLVNSRLQGIVKGTPTGEVMLNYIMGDESVQPGEAMVTSGGDRVFPRGLPLGSVAKVSMGRNLFLQIKIKPAVDLDRLEEVLVITAQKQRDPDVAGLGPIRASDILSQHLPSVPPQPVPGVLPGGAQPQPAPASGATQSTPQAAVPIANAVPNVNQKAVPPTASHSATPSGSAPNASKAAESKPVGSRPVTPKSVVTNQSASHDGQQKNTVGGPQHTTQPATQHTTPHATQNVPQTTHQSTPPKPRSKPEAEGTGPQ